MFFSKKSITPEEFVLFLSKQRHYVEVSAISTFQSELSYAGDIDRLKYEALLFAMWLITLTIARSKESFKDYFHIKMIEAFKVNPELKDKFVMELDKRYKAYFKAFEIWMSAPEKGYVLGSVMVEIIKNQNVASIIEGKYPQVGAVEAFKATTLFSSLYKEISDSVEALNKQYKFDLVYNEGK